jgi:NitT/TauT family transport system substrate-binding protein
MKKSVLALSILAALSVSLPAQAQTRHDVTQVVATVSFAFLPVYVAQHMGYFEAEGVDLKTVTASSAQAGLAAVTKGSAAYYLSTPVAGARSAAQGAPMLNCGALMAQNPTNIVVSAEIAKKFKIDDPSALPLARRVEMLKGLRLAAHTPGSSPDLALRYLARQSGLDSERDMQVLPIVQNAILAALENNRIDGFAYSSPLADQAIVKYGAKRLISMAAGEYPPLAGQLSITMVCNKDWVEKQTDAAAATLRAIWRAMRLMQSDPAKARAAARKAFGSMEDQVFDAAFETNRKAFPDSPRITAKQMSEALAFHTATGGSPINVSVEATFTNLAVDRAAQTMK